MGKGEMITKEDLDDLKDHLSYEFKWEQVQDLIRAYERLAEENEAFKSNPVIKDNLITEPVAQVSALGEFGLPCLQWLSADASLETPIGTLLYTHLPKELTESAITNLLDVYLSREMPEGTVIGNPLWWSGKISRVIRKASEK